MLILLPPRTLSYLQYLITVYFNQLRMIRRRRKPSTHNSGKSIRDIPISKRKKEFWISLSLASLNEHKNKSQQNCIRSTKFGTYYILSPESRKKNYWFKNNRFSCLVWKKNNALSINLRVKQKYSQREASKSDDWKKIVKKNLLRMNH